jgi:hypothetical protein
VKQVVFVTQNPALQMAIEGMQSEAFGNLTIRQCDTLEDALDYIRTDMNR